MAPVSERLLLEDHVELPRVYLAWPSPALFGPDDAELDLAADILASGKTSRLYRTLVHDQRVVADLSASQGSRELQGMFQITATAAPGKSLEEVHGAVMNAVMTLADRGPSVAELTREQTHAEAGFLSRLQTLGGFGGKSDQLNFYQTYLGKPDAADDDLNRYLGATPTSVRDAVHEWLKPERAVTLSVVPSGHPELALPNSRKSEVL